jgi:hypothetical protein
MNWLRVMEMARVMQCSTKPAGVGAICYRKGGHAMYMFHVYYIRERDSMA